MRLALFFASVSFFNLALFAQPLPRRVVRAVGEATLSVKPDQAKINIGVVTQASTAEEAAAQNASQTGAVLAQLRQVLGPNADIQTISYSISPNYRNTQEAPPRLIGFTVANTVEVTTSDLSSIGKVIDAGAQAGANNVQGLRFTVQEPEPLRAQVLGLAAKQARAHAEAIASGLGAHIGAVLSAQEGAVLTPVSLDGRAAPTSGIPTPIETGLVQVRATVTIDVELAS